MICPKCGNDVDGKWCKYCGTQLETDNDFRLNPYNTADNEEDNDNYEPDFYSETEPYQDRLTPKKHPANPQPHRQQGKNSAVIIAVLSVFVIVLLALVITFLAMHMSEESSVQNGAIDNAAGNTQVNSDNLFEKGKKYMDIGDYESAEVIFKQLIDFTDNDESALIYQILYNYNNAIKELADYNYDSASKFFEKIPAKYTDYAISEDVDNLETDITRGQTAYEIFDSVEDFIASKDYEAAKEAISILDSSVLSREDENKLDEYIQKINETQKKEKAQESAIELATPNAEDLLREYCDSFIKAVNNKDFEIVAPYMHPSSEIYTQQKKLIEQYISEGTTGKFEHLELNYLTKISNTVWLANVSQRETLYYNDGRKDSHQQGQVYTIEYIDSDFYLTKIG